MKDKNPIVFLDFDNTITTFDILDDMLECFSVDDRWKALEELWKEGKIGSKECLEGQVQGLRLTKAMLDSYLDKVKLDPNFKELLVLLKDKKINTVIVSDNFDYILKAILERNGITGIDVYSNGMKMVKDRVKASFPLNDPSCGDCAHCKKTTMKKIVKDDSRVFYVGDGRSDICASTEADVVFAKGVLSEYFKKKNLPHITIRDLGDVVEYFKAL